MGNIAGQRRHKRESTVGEELRRALLSKIVDQGGGQWAYSGKRQSTESLMLQRENHGAFWYKKRGATGGKNEHGDGWRSALVQTVYLHGGGGFLQKRNTRRRKRRTMLSICSRGRGGTRDVPKSGVDKKFAFFVSQRLRTKEGSGEGQLLRFTFGGGWAAMVGHGGG